MRSSSTGDIACSIRSASSCTSSHGIPSTSVRKRSIIRWRRTMCSACSRPESVKASAAVGPARDVAVALEPADHLVDGRGGQLHGAGDVGAGHRQPRLVQPEDGLEVLLLGDGGVLCGHGPILIRVGSAASASMRFAASSMNARVAGERWALRRVMKANVSTTGGSKPTLCRRRAKPRAERDRGASRSCRRGRARRGRAPPRRTRPRSPARSSRPRAGRARRAGGASGRPSRSARRRGSAAPRRAARSSSARLHALGVRGEVEQLVVDRGRRCRGRGRRSAARSARPRCGRRGRRRRPRRSSGRAAARARSGSACGSPARGRRAGSRARCRRCRRSPCRPPARAPRARSRRASCAAASVRSACGWKSRPASVSSRPRRPRMNSGEPELGLEPADLLRQARLGHVQGCCGRREGAVLDRGEEVFELLEGHRFCLLML